MSFNINLYSDGIPSKYGNVSDVSLEEAVDEMLYYDSISKKYTEEELTKILEDMKVGFQHYMMFGTRWSEFKVTKK